MGRENLLSDKQRGYFEAFVARDFPELPVTVFASNVIYNGMHWHNHMEMILCKIGETHLRVEGKEYLLKPGDFITIPGNASHEIYDGRSGNLQIICSIKANTLHLSEKEVIDCGTVTTPGLSGEEATEIRSLLGHMTVLATAAQNQQGAGFPLEEESNLFQYLSDQYRLLALLSEHKKTAESVTGKQHTLLVGCVLYIHEHLDDPVNAAVLANEMHVSEPTIYRLFREQIGMALGTYIMEVRLEAVCRYLQISKESITGIAYKCGFRSMNTFYRFFQKEMQMTPREYRKKHAVHASQLPTGQLDIMRFNRFENFYELGYTEKELL